MKKWTTLVVGLISAVVLMTGTMCSATPTATIAPTPTTASTRATVTPLLSTATPVALSPTPTPLPQTATPTPIKLTIHTFGVSRGTTWGYEWWSKEVTKRTGGRVQFDLVYVAVLGAPTEQLNNIGANLFQAGVIAPGYTAGKTPLATIVLNPGFSDDVEVLGRSLRDLLDDPALVAEYSQFKVKALFPTILSNFGLSSTKQIRTLADIKGLRIRTLGSAQDDVIKMLGGVPTAMSTTDVYTSMQTGALDGAIMDVSTVEGFKWPEVAKYYVNAPFGCGSAVFGINQDVFQKLPQDVQKVMLDVAQDVPKHMYDLFADTEGKMLARWQTDLKVQLIKLSDADKSAIRYTYSPRANQSWIDKLDSQGLPGTRVAEQLTNLVKKYEAQLLPRK